MNKQIIYLCCSRNSGISRFSFITHWKEIINTRFNEKRDSTNNHDVIHSVYMMAECVGSEYRWVDIFFKYDVLTVFWNIYYKYLYIL